MCFCINLEVVTKSPLIVVQLPLIKHGIYRGSDLMYTNLPLVCGTHLYNLLEMLSCFNNPSCNNGKV